MRRDEYDPWASPFTTLHYTTLHPSDRRLLHSPSQDLSQHLDLGIVSISIPHSQDKATVVVVVEG